MGTWGAGAPGDDDRGLTTNPGGTVAEPNDAAGELSGLLGAVLVQYADRALGPSGVKAVMDRVGEQEVLSLVEHWQEWVDFEVVLATAIAVAELCHEPDIGRRTGEELFRVLVERGSLASVAHMPLADALPDVVESLNTATDLRRGLVMEVADGFARIVVTSQDAGRSRFLCRLLSGVYSLIPTIRHSTGAVVETACIHRGDRVCEFQLRWREDVVAGPGVDPWADRIGRLQQWAVGLATDDEDHAPAALEAVRLLEEIRHQALTDPLTGLANRSGLELRVGEEAVRGGGSIDGLTLVFVDLDGFKATNDVHGHAVGDELLVQVAARLEGAVRSSDLVARLGGDEFVVLFTDVHDDARIDRLVGKVEAVFRDAFVIVDHLHHVHGSVGVSRAPRDGGTLAALLDHADGAMYRRKRLRRGEGGQAPGPGGGA
jgi:diguanylate cyclase (GGDEF)-like protein